MNYTFQFGIVLARWPEFLEGAWITMQLALAGFWLGVPFGLFFASVRTSGPKWAKRIVGAYVIFITNIPVLIQVWFLYFGLPDLGILLDKYTSVVLALAGTPATLVTVAGRVQQPGALRADLRLLIPFRRSVTRAVGCE